MSKMRCWLCGGKEKLAEAKVDDTNTLVCPRCLELIKGGGDSTMLVKPSPLAKFKSELRVEAKRQDYGSAVCPVCLAKDDILVISVDGVDTFYSCNCGEAWTLDTARQKLLKAHPDPAKRAACLDL